MKQNDRSGEASGCGAEVALGARRGPLGWGSRVRAFATQKREAAEVGDDRVA